MKKLYRELSAKRSSRRLSAQEAKKATSAPPEDYGLKEVYEGHNANVDIVAIHGHGGHWKTSWIDQPSGTFWLQDLLPKASPGTRILSYYYDTSSSSTRPIEDIAVELFAELSRLRAKTGSEKRPIIFLAHSSGGIFIKGALGALGAPSEDLSKAYLCRIKESTYGIVFFGVPQHAEDGFSNLSAMDAGSLIPENPLMAALRRDLMWLKDSNEKFSRSRKDFAITYFTEAPSQVTSGQPQLSSISPIEADAAFSHANVIPLSKTHGHMIKFSDAGDRDFQKVGACVYMMVSEAIKSTKTRDEMYWVA